MGAGVALTRAHQQAQIRHAAATAAMTREIARRHVDGWLTRDEFLVVGSSAEMIAHQGAVALSSRYLVAHRRVEAPELVGVDLVVAEFDLSSAVGRATSTADAIGRVRTARPQHEFDQDFEAITGRYGTWAARAVQMASRDTIVDSAEAAGSRWRRVSDGNPCSLCAMLVGRGPVYRSRKSAGRVFGQGPVAKKRGTRDIGQRFHDYCGCTVEEVTGDAVAKCQADGVPATPENITKAMRELGQGVVHDATAPETQTGGASGGKEPPRRGAGPFKEMGDPPDPQDKAAWKAYWKERQDALPLDFKGDWLESHEVESYERLLRLGLDIDPIQRRVSTSTNDFYWLNNNGHPTELKTSKAKYETIRQRIYEAVRDARVHGVIKDVFVIDIGKDALTQELADDLSRYNVDRSRFQVAELWVVSEDGRSITRVPLA